MGGGGGGVGSPNDERRPPGQHGGGGGRRQGLCGLEGGGAQILKPHQLGMANGAIDLVLGPEHITRGRGSREKINNK